MASESSMKQNNYPLVTKVDYKFLTLFAYDLFMFDNCENVSVRSFRRISKFSFLITIIIRLPMEIGVSYDDDKAEEMAQKVEDYYVDYIKSEKFKKKESKELVDHMVWEFEHKRGY